MIENALPENPIGHCTPPQHFPALDAPFRPEASILFSYFYRLFANFFWSAWCISPRPLGALRPNDPTPAGEWTPCDCPPSIKKRFFRRYYGRWLKSQTYWITSFILMMLLLWGDMEPGMIEMIRSIQKRLFQSRLPRETWWRARNTSRAVLVR